MGLGSRAGPSYARRLPGLASFAPLQVFFFFFITLKPRVE